MALRAERHPLGLGDPCGAAALGKKPRPLVLRQIGTAFTAAPKAKNVSTEQARGGDVIEKINLDGWIPVLYNGEVRFIGPSAVKK
jgi:hypothetical protein